MFGLVTTSVGHMNGGSHCAVMSGMAAVVLGGMGRFSGCGKTMARSVRAWGRRIKSRSRSGVEWTRNKCRAWFSIIIQKPIDHTLK